MAIKIKNEKKLISLNKLIFKEDNIFELSGQNFDEKVLINIICPLELDNEYDERTDQFDIYLLKNPNVNENSIFQVYDVDTKIRLGWIFPIQALVSKEHDYSQNKYFLKYAYIAIKKLLQKDIEIENKDFDYLKEDFTILDFYKDDYIVLVIDNENTSKIEEYNINDYIVGLYKYGYCFNGYNSLDHFSEINKNLNLHRIKKSFRNEQYIIELYKDFLGSETSYLLKFYLLYQVIEMAIEKIFNIEFKSIVNSINDNPKELFDKKDELATIANEKHRVKLLFGSYCSKIDCRNELKNSCDELLESQGKKIGDSMETSLYSVRNLLVHCYREIKSNNKECIQEINSFFEECIIQLLTEALTNM